MTVTCNDMAGGSTAIVNGKTYGITGPDTTNYTIRGYEKIDRITLDRKRKGKQNATDHSHSWRRLGPDSESHSPEQKEIVSGELQLEACIVVRPEEVELANTSDSRVNDASVESRVCTLNIEFELEGTPLQATWTGPTASRDGVLQISGKR